MECTQFCGKIGAMYLEIKHVYPISNSSFIYIMSFTYYETGRKKNERMYILSGQNKTREERGKEIPLGEMLFAEKME
jgi:hypothetical protein